MMYLSAHVYVCIAKMDDDITKAGRAETTLRGSNTVFGVLLDHRS